MIEKCCLDDYMKIYNDSKQLIDMFENKYTEKIKCDSTIYQDIQELKISFAKADIIFNFELGYKQRNILEKKYTEKDIFTNRYVSEAMGISRSTLQRHIKQINNKFQESKDIFVKMNEVQNRIKQAYYDMEFSRKDLLFKTTLSKNDTNVTLK